MAEIGHFNPETKKYDYKTLEGKFEIVSLSGNMSMMDDKPVAHLHIALGQEDFSVVGGHLVSCEVDPTCEIIITPLDSKIQRAPDQKSGLNLLKLG